MTQTRFTCTLTRADESVDHLPQARDIRGMILLGEPSPTADGAGSGGGES